jgi:hypothetical protein
LRPVTTCGASIGISVRQVQAAADLLTAQAKIGFSFAAVTEAVPVLGSEGDTLVAQLRADADALEGGSVPPSERREAAARRRASQVAALEAWGGLDGDQVSSMVGVVWTGEMLHAAELAVHRATDAIAQVAAARG